VRPPSDPRDKSAWRRAARAARTHLDGPTWSAALVAALRAWPPFRDAGRVAIYLAFGSEPDLSALHRDGPRFYAPRVQAGRTSITLHELGGPLERHPMGMHEPSSDAPRVAPGELDLILVPGLAFDAAGTRLGYGAGLYDRLLAGLDAATPRLGVGHPSLVVETLPREAHDVRMTHLLLPGGVQGVRPDS
jgi:5-formyltetrahydrofolate cyclo-ligase